MERINTQHPNGISTAPNPLQVLRVQSCTGVTVTPNQMATVLFLGTHYALHPITNTLQHLPAHPTPHPAPSHHPNPHPEPSYHLNPHPIHHLPIPTIPPTTSALLAFSMAETNTQHPGWLPGDMSPNRLCWLWAKNKPGRAWRERANLDTVAAVTNSRQYACSWGTVAVAKILAAL